MSLFATYFDTIEDDKTTFYEDITIYNEVLEIPSATVLNVYLIDVDPEYSKAIIFASFNKYLVTLKLAKTPKTRHVSGFQVLTTQSKINQ